MRPGVESQTAVQMCMARALEHRRADAKDGFSDPVALTLLPDEARSRVERMLAQEPPGGLSERLERWRLGLQSKMVAARTVAIDRAIRESSAAQLVILGAGLDGRAWRMNELAEKTVFEFDHPDSQRAKVARAASLTQLARELRYVPVDLGRDNLATALTAAGHERTIATIWLWEGVLMYLDQSAIDATLATIEEQSAPGSRLIVLYHCPAVVLRLIGALLRQLGEPLHSAFTPDAMRSLLAQHGFLVVRDNGLPALGAELSPSVARVTRRMKHIRLATADRESHSIAHR